MKAALAKNSRRQIDSFTGLRGLAVLFVMFYHWLPDVVPGGFLGVCVFLFLSGYLVTDQFLAELHHKNRISVGSFYLRRLRRLYPPLLFFLLVMTTLLLFVQPELLSGYRGGFFSTLFGVNNFWQISQDFSYFDRFTKTQVFTHLWTLGLELQFYLLWPWVVLLVARITENERGRRKLLAGVCAVLSLVSALIMAVLFLRGISVTRVYYGLDTRMFGFLMGGLLACFFGRNHLMQLAKVLRPDLLRWGTLVSSILFLILMIVTPGTKGVTYLGGMFVFTLILLVLSALAASQETWLGRGLSNGVFLFLGKRSYSLYLWQYALMVLLDHMFLRTPLPRGAAILMQTFFLLILAECTYRLMEQKGMRWIPEMARALRYPHQRRSLAGLVAFGISVVLLLTTVVGLVRAKPADQTEVAEMKKRLEENAQIFSSQHVPQPSRAASVQEPAASAKRPAGAEATQPATEVGGQNADVLAEFPDLKLTQAQLQKAQKLPIFAVGDSVLQMCGQSLQEFFPQMYIDATVSRQFEDGLAVLQQKKEEGSLPGTILYALGTNGVLTSGQIEKLSKQFPECQIYLLTIVTDQPWESKVNALLQEGVKDAPNLHLVDWHGFAKGKNFFYADGTHPNPTGTPYYAQFIAHGILSASRS